MIKPMHYEVNWIALRVIADAGLTVAEIPMVMEHEEYDSPLPVPSGAWTLVDSGDFMAVARQL